MPEMGYCERSLPHRFISRRSGKLLSAVSLFVYSPMRLLSPQEAPATSIAAKA